MEIGQFIAFNLALLVAIASPGPSLLYLSRTALVHGRRTGIATAAGLGTMAALWTLAALLGLDTVFELFPWSYSVVKTFGAGYLIYIAWMTWRSAAKPPASASTPRSSRSFLDGVLINLANPKSVLFAAAVVVVIFPSGISPVTQAMIFANHLVVELVVQSGLAILFSAPALSRRYLDAKRVLDRIAAFVLGGLGLSLLLDR